MPPLLQGLPGHIQMDRQNECWGRWGFVWGPVRAQPCGTFAWGRASECESWQILWEHERAGADLRIRWVLSHLGVEGNAGADRLAEQGREAHPNKLRSLPKRRLVEPHWEALGLEEMSSHEGEAWDSGGSSDVALGCSVSPLSDGGVLRSGSSTDGGDTWRDSLSSNSSEFSTDVSDTRWGKCRKRGDQE